ncbi:MAG: GntR family transcriptional regulator [Oscillospiraceae bacterium]|jgi:DNA-binding GntR family transcriptional regulator|nr:GntR family transcriptional regulator [Oscillospiraceae bacterium]
MARIKKASLVDQIYSRLREDIITLKIPMGTRLNVNELQSELGVSCTPIREAVNRLQQEELVIYENNVGARVLTLDEHDVREIHELALTLQQAAVQLSMKNGNLDEMLDAVEEQLDRYKSARSPREGVKAVHNLIGVFYHHCGNRRLDRSMVAIQGQMLLLRHIYAECPGWSGHAAELTALRDGVEDEDARAVCAALQSYMEQSTPAILKWLKDHE